MNLIRNACLGTTADANVATPANTQRSVRAVCVDVIDLGNIETQRGPRHRVKLVFETEERKANDFPRTASKTYTVSYWEKAPLRQHLESWRGRPLTTSQIQRGVTLSSLVGRECDLEVCDAMSSKGFPYLKVLSIRKSARARLPVSGSYRRWDSLPGGKPTPQETACSRGATDALDDDDTESRLEQQAEEMLASRESGKEVRHA